MRRRPNQSGERPPNPFPFDGADPDEGILHGGAPHVEPAGAPARRRLGFSREGFVQAAPERTGVVRRRAHARALRGGGRFLIDSGGQADGPVVKVCGGRRRVGGVVAVESAGIGGGCEDWSTGSARCVRRHSWGFWGIFGILVFFGRWELKLANVSLIWGMYL